MPRGDMTGPNGQGPMTGRGMGYCAGFNVPGFMNPGFGFGRGFGRGRGMGRGRGFRFRAGFPIAPVIPQQVIPIQQYPAQPLIAGQEKDYLKQELDVLKAEIQEIESRLKEL